MVLLQKNYNNNDGNNDYSYGVNNVVVAKSVLMNMFVYLRDQSVFCTLDMQR